MYSLTLLGITAFLLSLILTPIVRNLARRWGLVDHPTENRSVHTIPVPRLGGVAIIIAYAGAFLALFAIGLSATRIVREALPFAQALLPAAFLMFLTGLCDDIWGLKPWQKLLGQIAAACLAVWAGITVDGLVGLHFPLWLAIPITLLWLVGCANAFNLIDGVDGLAAGVGLFATITMLIAALIDKNVPLALATVPLAGALLGFLRFNFNPATIFLGDSGSLTVGFLLGCFGVVWGQKSATVLGLTAPLMALAVPLLDTGLSITRRLLRGKPVWDADRGHIHHRLLDRGLDSRRVALVLYAVAAVGAVLSVAQSFFQNNFGGLIVLLFVAAAWIGVQHLGYVEFGVAGRMFVDGVFRRHFQGQLTLHHFELSLQEAETPQQCWEVLEAAANEFGYARVQARLGDQEFSPAVAFERSAIAAGGWSVQIPICDGDYVALDRSSNSAAPLARVGPFADVIQRTLQQKQWHQSLDSDKIAPLPSPVRTRSAAAGE